MLLHHVLGRTKGIEAIADQLKDAGHTVHVPDLFHGCTFSSLEEGLAFVKEIGFNKVTTRGVLAAQELAQTREGSRGALFFMPALPTSEFESQWPIDLLCKFTP